jgi:hypothetical protein
MNPRNYITLKSNNLATLSKNPQVDDDGIQRYTLSYKSFDPLTGQLIDAGSEQINPAGWQVVVENYVKTMTDSNKTEWQADMDNINAMLSDIVALA